MLRAFPFQTFDDIAGLGLEVHVYCPNCYRTVGPIDLADERLRGRSFNRTRFVCTQARRIYDDAWRVCGCLGHVIVRPSPADFIPPAKVIPWCSISCPRCVPTWEISQAAKHLPPWNSIWNAPGVRLACPTCRSALTTSWSGLEGVPHTDGYGSCRHGNRQSSSTATGTFWRSHPTASGFDRRALGAGAAPHDPL